MHKSNQINFKNRILKKHEKKQFKPNVNLFLGMLLIVWIRTPGPPGCWPLSPANYSAGFGHVIQIMESVCAFLGYAIRIFLHE